MRADVIRICAEFDVRIIRKQRYPQPGETRAVASLERILRKHGEGHLRLILTTLAETKGAGGLINETTLWAVSDLVLACPQWAEKQPSDWLEAWDSMPLGEMMFTVEDLSGHVNQRHALAGIAYQYLAQRLQPKEPAAGRLGRLADEQKLELGRKLLRVKEELPHGHFGPWLESREEFTPHMARQCMRIAREARLA